MVRSVRQRCNVEGVVGKGTCDNAFVQPNTTCCCNPTLAPTTTLRYSVKRCSPSAWSIGRGGRQGHGLEPAAGVKRSKEGARQRWQPPKTTQQKSSKAWPLKHCSFHGLLQHFFAFNAPPAASPPILPCSSQRPPLLSLPYCQHDSPQMKPCPTGLPMSRIPCPVSRKPTTPPAWRHEPTTPAYPAT